MFKNFKNRFVSWLKKVKRNLPFRIAIGRFGMWLVKIGGFIQLRYAGWNRKLRLKHEFPPNPDICCLHFSEPATTECILSYMGPNSQLDKQTPMIEELFKVRGITEMFLKPYELQIEKAKVFEWGEILPKAEKIVIKHLTR